MKASSASFGFVIQECDTTTTPLERKTCGIIPLLQNDYIGSADHLKTIIGRSSIDIGGFLKFILESGGLGALPSESCLNVLRLLVSDNIYFSHPIDKLLVPFLSSMCCQGSLHSLGVVMAQTALTNWLHATRSYPGQDAAERRLAAMEVLETSFSSAEARKQRERNSRPAANLVRLLAGESWLAEDIASSNHQSLKFSPEASFNSSHFSSYCDSFPGVGDALSEEDLQAVNRAQEISLSIYPNQPISDSRSSLALSAPAGQIASVHVGRGLEGEGDKTKRIRSVHNPGKGQDQDQDLDQDLSEAKRRRAHEGPDHGLAGPEEHNPEDKSSPGGNNKKVAVHHTVSNINAGSNAGATARAGVAAISVHGAKAAAELLQQCTSFGSALSLALASAGTGTGSGTVLIPGLQNLAETASRLLFSIAVVDQDQSLVLDSEALTRLSAGASSSRGLGGLQLQALCCLKLRLWRAPDQLLQSIAEALALKAAAASALKDHTQLQSTLPGPGPGPGSGTPWSLTLQQPRRDQTSQVAVWVLVAAALLPRARALRQSAGRHFLKAVEVAAKASGYGPGSLGLAVMHGVLARCLRTTPGAMAGAVPAVTAYQHELVARAGRTLVGPQDRERLLQQLLLQQPSSSNSATSSSIFMHVPGGEVGTAIVAGARIDAADAAGLALLAVCDGLLSPLAAYNVGLTAGANASDMKTSAASIPSSRESNKTTALNGASAQRDAVDGAWDLWESRGWIWAPPPLGSLPGLGLTPQTQTQAQAQTKTQTQAQALLQATVDSLKTLHALIVSCPSLQPQTLAAVLSALDNTPPAATQPQSTGLVSAVGTDSERTRWALSVLSTVCTKYGALLREGGLVGAARISLGRYQAYSASTRGALEALDKL